MQPIQTPRNKKTYPIGYISQYSPKYKSRYRDQYVPVLSEYQRGSFDSANRDHFAYYLNVDPQGHGYIVRGKQRVTARYVFETPTILPYSILPTKEIQPEIDMLIQTYSPQTPRVPLLFRISDDFAIDDLGRIYGTGKNGRLYWRQYNLSGDLRNRFKLTNHDGSYLVQSAYFFAGIAGYDSRLQDHFAGSGRYDFHHVAENRLDLRPTAVFPIETNLHRVIHDELTRPGGFFKWSKQFYV